ncbi:hypothetical protein [Microbacterium sp. CH1]|uniref:hypothetical protein n=1 Tax=Microbacterium sp. CH1 TaxID=1770208 RepID=UPI000ABA4475|nr:hypothetical protein [Microbacterium sp. CH1]
MRTIHKVIAALGIVGLLSATPLAATAEAPPAPPATDSPAPTPGTEPTNGARALHVLGGEIIHSGPDAPQPPINPTELAAIGLEGQVVSVEKDKQGATFYFYEDGDYVYTLPDKVKGPKGDVAAQWSSGTYCAGNFVDIAKLNGQLYWGGSNYCSGTNNVYVHSLKIVLRDGCTGPFCWQEETGSASAPGSAYDMVKSVSQFHTCANSNERRYDMIAYPMVRSVQFGPIVDSQNFVVPCDWI